LRVFVNAVAARLGGGVRHLNPFLAGLAEHVQEATFDVCVTPELHQRNEHERLNWHVVDVPRGAHPRRLLWDNVTVPQLAQSHNLLLSPLNFGPLRVKPAHLLFQRNPTYFDPTYYRQQPALVRARLAGYRWFATINSRRADRIIVPSSAMQDLLLPHVAHATPVTVVPHGFDALRSREQSMAPPLSCAAPWARRGLRLLHVGHPSPHKNVGVLADILADVLLLAPGRDPGIAVTFQSDDKNAAAEEFVMRARERSVLDRVTFLGTVPQHDVFPLYRAANVFLFPSLTESFGFPLLEALAAGTAIVASDISSNRETAGDLAGYCPARDARAAAHLVLSASINGERREPRFARAAEFSWDVHCSRVAEIIRELVERHHVL
jgi:glycosyltransferase involved in cell wall biosynthesis